MSLVSQVDKHLFQFEVLNSPVPVVVDFYASWCPPCRALSPLLERLATEYAGQIKFVKVESDEEPELAEAYNVSALPTLVFFHRGQVVGKSVGLPQEQTLRSELDMLLK